jgi:hypothetical protein
VAKDPKARRTESMSGSPPKDLSEETPPSPGLGVTLTQPLGGLVASDCGLMILSSVVDERESSDVPPLGPRPASSLPPTHPVRVFVEEGMDAAIASVLRDLESLRGVRWKAFLWQQLRLQFLRADGLECFYGPETLGVPTGEIVPRGWRDVGCPLALTGSVDLTDVRLDWPDGPPASPYVSPPPERPRPPPPPPGREARIIWRAKVPRRCLTRMGPFKRPPPHRRRPAPSSATQ